MTRRFGFAFLGAALSPLLAAALASSPATAHEYWLAPSRYAAGAGDTVTIRALVGTGFRGEARPYAMSRVRRFELHGPRTVDLRPGAMNGDLDFARFVVADGGGQRIGYETDFAEIELPADEFDRYLRLEGLDGPLAERLRLGGKAGPGRERYARSAKTWLTGTDATRATRPVGLPLEIVPLADPAAAARLPVKVLFRGRPLDGALVRAWVTPLGAEGAPFGAAGRDSVGPALELRTAKDGTATLDVSRPGEWLIGTVHMIRSSDRAAADWESYWSSLTFERREGR